MKAREDAEFVDVLARTILAKKELEWLGRRASDKFHVSELIICIKRSWYRRMGYAEEPSLDRVWRTLMGSVIHEALQVLGAKEVRVERDGIVGHIDILDDIPVEIYTTRASAAAVAPEEFFYKVRQLMCYCHMLGVTEGRLLVFYISGAYRPPRPIMRCRLVEFEPEELEDWWKKVLTRRDLLKAALEEKRPPPFHAELAFCRNCGFARICQPHLFKKGGDLRDWVWAENPGAGKNFPVS